MAGYGKKDPSPTAVYRFYNADDHLLYVGVSMDLASRFRTHRYQRSWWRSCVRIDVAWHPNRAEALAAETLAIETENPMFNGTGPNAYRRPRKFNHLADALVKAIRDDPIPAGSRITNKRLCEWASVSYPTSTLAINALIQRGVLVRRGKGVYVAEKEISG